MKFRLFLSFIYSGKSCFRININFFSGIEEYKATMSSVISVIFLFLFIFSFLIRLINALEFSIYEGICCGIGLSKMLIVLDRPV
eukprot:Pgem_evm2s13445